MRVSFLYLPVHLACPRLTVRFRKDAEKHQNDLGAECRPHTDIGANLQSIHMRYQHIQFRRCTLGPSVEAALVNYALPLPLGACHELMETDRERSEDWLQRNVTLATLLG
jgi:hypothetical protein